MKMNNQTALYIKVNAKDNVAIVVNDGGLPVGTQFSAGLILIKHVPQGHKVTLMDISDGEFFIRYGEVVGYAIGDIKQGSWIHEVE